MIQIAPGEVYKATTELEEEGQKSAYLTVPHRSIFACCVRKQKKFK